MVSFALTFYVFNLRLFRLDSEVKRVRFSPFSTYCDMLEKAKSGHSWGLIPKVWGVYETMGDSLCCAAIGETNLKLLFEIFWRG